FAHRALLDYLAAEYVEKHELDERLLAHVAEERWREVILIATGLVPPGRAKRLVSELIGREDTGAQELEIAGLSLAEDVQLGEDLRAEVRQRLQERLAKEGSSAAFGRLATALMVADLATASKWMGEVLRGGDPGLRLRVLGLLPELGEGHMKALVPLLGQLIGASDEDATVRSQAALALAGIGVEPDAAIWQTLGAARGDPDRGLRRAATWAWCEFGRFAELGLVEVPAGEFVRGSDDMEDREKPAHRLHLPTSYIARCPVTLV
ncbi:MAG: formylglycine-generating enzyme family protein, partial [bacterium]|nr:formylglycine-generating enzyme family protein [bacterium]